MLFTKSGAINFNENQKIVRFVYRNLEIFYSGFLFNENGEADEQAVKTVADYYLKHGKPDFRKIFGNFYLFLHNIKNNESIIFTDNSGGMKIYYFENMISDSFLELIEQNDFSEKDINYRAINEFLHLGYVYFNETFITEIHKLDADYFLKIIDGKIRMEEKNIGKIHSDKGVNFFETFDALSKAIKGKKIVADITGGTDSRLIACLLAKNGLSPDFAINGVSGNSDIEIGKQVAEILNSEIKIFYHEPKNINEETFLEILKITDAQTDIAAYHVNYEYHKNLSAANYNLHLSGVGGELFKDFWWIQDIPFYSRKKSDIEKLYSLRIESVPFPHEITGEKIKKFSVEFRKNTIEKLREFQLATNTETYDNIYYYYKMRTTASTNLSIVAKNFNPVYAFLIEHEIVKFGFSLKRSERFFNNFHRKILSEFCPELAKLITTEGVSCSDKIYDKLADIPLYFANKFKRLLKQILRKITRKTFLQEIPVNLLIYDLIRKEGYAKSLEKELKKSGLLAEKVDINSLSDVLLGKYVTVGLFLKKLN